METIEKDELTERDTIIKDHRRAGRDRGEGNEKGREKRP